MARSEFQDNAISLTQHIDLSGFGNDIAASITSASISSSNVDKVIAEAQSRVIADAANMENLGIASGSVAGITGKLDYFNKTQREAHLRKEQAKGRNSDLYLLEIMNSGGMGAHIGGIVFGDMSDDEVNACVKEIEAETGQSFDDYAKEILGEDMPERKAGESDVDYQRRVLKDIAEEMIDPHTGKIKPQYTDSPVADIIKRNDGYQATIKQVSSLNKQIAQNGMSEEVIQKTEAITKTGMSSAYTVEDEINHEDAQIIAETSQHELRDGDAFDKIDQTDELNDDFFNMVSDMSPMKVASTNGRLEFGAAASPDAESNERSASAEHTNTLQVESIPTRTL